jgi:hypothetical protein
MEIPRGAAGVRRRHDRSQLIGSRLQRLGAARSKATGTAAIFIDQVKPAHIIRKVLLRQVAILNYINPF